MNVYEPVFEQNRITRLFSTPKISDFNGTEISFIFA